MTKPMSKTELVSSIADALEMDKKSVQAVLDQLSTTILKEVGNGGAVTIPGIVKVSCRDRPARKVRNPATGEVLDKPADRKAAATVLKAVKDAVNA
ncbi:MAG: HU family DNA-binding protein [Pseudomonadota bacterium]